MNDLVKINYESDRLKIFKNQDFGEIRTIFENDEVWFVAKDVCAILEIQNTTQALESLDKDERSMFNIGRQGACNIINESGLYALIIRSRKPEAKKFRKWITSEVLPAIRKHGMYATDELLNNPEFAIAVFTALKEERDRVKELNKTVTSQKQQIEEFLPKVGYYDTVLNCKNLIAVSIIAKDFGWSAMKLNKYLHEKGVQYKQGEIWLLHQKYAEEGYTGTKTHTYPSDNGPQTKEHTYWTQRGKMFIHDLLKKDGIYPNIEGRD